MSAYAAMIRPVRTLLQGVCDALLPQTCAVCDRWIPAGAAATCPACQHELATIQQASYCPRCGRSMRAESIHERGCARCVHEDFWNVAGVVRVGPYAPPLRALTTGLKYVGRERNAELAAELMHAALARRGLLNELDGFVPVPMSRLRRWQRPCDHAEVLTAALVRRTGIPILRAVRRIRHTPSQTRVTSRQQRFENVRGCFGPARGAAARIAGQRVCIVDNLLATGATAHEVSKILRQLGARTIHAAVICRTVLAGDVQAIAGDPGVANRAD